MHVLNNKKLRIVRLRTNLLFKACIVMYGLLVYEVTFRLWLRILLVNTIHNVCVCVKMRPIQVRDTLRRSRL